MDAAQISEQLSDNERRAVAVLAEITARDSRRIVLNHRHGRCSLLARDGVTFHREPPLGCDRFEAVGLAPSSVYVFRRLGLIGDAGDVDIGLCQLVARQKGVACASNALESARDLAVACLNNGCIASVNLRLAASLIRIADAPSQADAHRQNLREQIETSAAVLNAKRTAFYEAWRAARDVVYLSLGDLQNRHGQNLTAHEAAVEWAGDVEVAARVAGEHVNDGRVDEAAEYLHSTTGIPKPCAVREADIHAEWASASRALQDPEGEPQWSKFLPPAKWRKYLAQMEGLDELSETTWRRRKEAMRTHPASGPKRVSFDLSHFAGQSFINEISGQPATK